MRPTPPTSHTSPTAIPKRVERVGGAGGHETVLGTDRGRRDEQPRHVGEQRAPGIDDAHAAVARAAAQRGRRIGAVESQRDRGHVEPLHQREIHGFGPPDHGHDLIVVEQRQRRAQPIGGAVGLEQPGSFVRAERGVGGRRECARTPTRAGRTRGGAPAPAGTRPRGWPAPMRILRARRRLRSRAGLRRPGGESPPASARRESLHPTWAATAKTARKHGGSL